MKLPHSDRAQIPSEKLRGYLLSSEHPIGRFKARFFHALGYKAESWEILERDLVDAAQSAEAELVPSPYGDKYLVGCTLTGPAGLTAGVISVWILARSQDIPRFITAYPLE